MSVYPVLAHAGGFGWDEALFMALPVVILLLLARQARKKVDETEEDVESAERPSADG